MLMQHVYKSRFPKRMERAFVITTMTFNSLKFRAIGASDPGGHCRDDHLCSCHWKSVALNPQCCFKPFAICIPGGERGASPTARERPRRRPPPPPRGVAVTAVRRTLHRNHVRNPAVWRQERSTGRQSATETPPPSPGYDDPDWPGDPLVAQTRTPIGPRRCQSARRRESWRNLFGESRRSVESVDVHPPSPLENKPPLHPPQHRVDAALSGESTPLWWVFPAKVD